MSGRSALPWLSTLASLLAVTLTLVLALRWTPPAPTHGIDAQAMLDASVSIRTFSNVHIDQFGDSVWRAGSGSGFLVSSADCEIWTNNHVIEDAALVEVFPRGWNDATGIPAEVVNATPRSDIAVLRMTHCENIPEVLLGSSTAVRAGDEVYAVGNPLGRNPGSISRGIISHTQRYLGGTTPYLQTDAAINPGNSGGALFNRRGEVIGINSAIASPGAGNVGIGYAVPIDYIRRVVARLHDGPPSWGDAGIDGLLSDLSADEAAVFRVPGDGAAVVVNTTPTQRPAADTLRARDVIYAIDDTPVEDAKQVQRILTDHATGTVVNLSLVRDGKPIRVDLTLAEGYQPKSHTAPDSYAGYLGMSLEMWTGKNDQSGTFEHPVITHVQSLGPAHRAHITSSQHAAIVRGPFAIAYQLDVKTISGVVYDGIYRPIREVAQLTRIARQASLAEAPLLLEIELWKRSDPRQIEASLERAGAAYFRVVPRPAPVHAQPPGAPGLVSQTGASTPIPSGPEQRADG